jgi:drug/metabolite transporter (DMT)-like permease
MVHPRKTFKVHLIKKTTMQKSPKMTTSPTLGIIVATGAAVAWGLVYASTQDLVRNLNPASLWAMSFVCGGILLFPVALFNRTDIITGISMAPKEFVGYCFVILFAKFLNVASISLLGGTNAGLIELSYPVWTAFFLWLMHNEKPSTGVYIGGTLILLGVGVIAISEREVAGNNSGSKNVIDLDDNSKRLLLSESKERSSSSSFYGTIGKL